MAEGDEGNDANLQQYQAVLDLEQDRWDLSEWGCPIAEGSSPPSSPSLSQGEDEESSESEEEPDGGEVCDPYDNCYVRKLRESADLHLLQPGAVYSAFDGDEKELGLFHLFLTKNYLETVCKWTNEVLVGKGKKECDVKEFYVYIGLELGMSLLKFNDIKKSYDGEAAASDSLWACRSILDQLIRKSASIAVPIGVSALDENSCPTKARSKAKTNSPNKPAKYAIRFYAVVGHKYCYLTSMFGNRAGNTTGVEGVHDYCRLF